MIKIISLLFLFIPATSSIFFTQEDTLPQSIKRGESVYQANCASCHMPEGEGLEAVFPPLAKTDYVKNANRAIGIILNGQEGEISVNGKTYNTPMAALPQLTDQEVADVLNFVRNSWGNKDRKSVV